MAPRGYSSHNYLSEKTTTVQIVKENAVRRSLIGTATDIITDSYDEEDVTTLLDNAERNILNTYREREKGPDSWFTEIFLYINSLKIILLDL